MDRTPLTQRWFEAGVFLSMDLTQSFFEELWVPCENQLKLQHDLRALLSDALEADAYYTDQDTRGYRIMEWYYSSYGTQRFQELNSWIRHILVLEGPDRPAETCWKPLSFRISHQAEDESTAPAWVVRLMKEVASSQRTLTSPLDNKIEAAEDQPLQEWDQRVLEAEDSLDNALLIKTSLVAEYNIFLIAWERSCSTLSYSELQQLREVGKQFAPDMGMEESDIVFPGAWRFELAQFLSKFANHT